MDGGALAAWEGTGVFESLSTVERYCEFEVGDHGGMFEDLQSGARFLRACQVRCGLARARARRDGVSCGMSAGKTRVGKVGPRLLELVCKSIQALRKVRELLNLREQNCIAWYML